MVILLYMDIFAIIGKFLYQSILQSIAIIMVASELNEVLLKQNIESKDSQLVMSGGNFIIAED